MAVLRIQAMVISQNGVSRHAQLQRKDPDISTCWGKKSRLPIARRYFLGRATGGRCLLLALV